MAMSLVPMTPPRTPTRPRPLSLHPSSPFVNPFDSPGGPPSASTTSSVTASPVRDHEQVEAVRTAYVAGRSTADLISVHDLDLTPRLQTTHRLDPPAVIATPSDRSRFDHLPTPDSPSSAIVMATKGSPVGPRVPKPPHPASTPRNSLAWPQEETELEELSPTGPDIVPIPDRAPQQHEPDQSFIRLSLADSSVWSDYVPPSETPTNASTNRSLPGNGQSFFRFSQAASSVSDVAPSAAVKSSNAMSVITEESTPPRSKSARRESSDTFGKARRWSALDSVLSDERQNGSVVEEDDQKTSSFGRRRRPVSMSSASTSTGYSGPHIPDFQRSYSADEYHPPAPGYYPSPTMRQHSHKKPESEEIIQAHLLKASAQNPNRIVPRPRQSAASTPIHSSPKQLRHPPSSGTPLKGGHVEEMAEYSSESELGYQGVKRNNSTRGRMSKLEQVLGAGAESARHTLALEKRALESAVEMKSAVGGPVPPLRGHRPSASLPYAPPLAPKRVASQPSTPITPSRPRGKAEVLHTPHRSPSVDSLLSLRPSIAESTHTLARLIPAGKDLPSIPQHRLIDPSLMARNDLRPEQRTVLLKRAKKLEQMLGEPLGEQEMEQLVIDPSTVPNMGVTPQSVRLTREGQVSPSGTLQRSKSTMTQRAKAAFGMTDDTASSQAIETFVQADARYLPRRRGTQTSQESKMSEDSSLASAKDPWFLREGQAPEETEDTRRTRRLQLAKAYPTFGRRHATDLQLHRILGVPIPVELLTAPSQDSLVESKPSAAVNRSRAVSPTESFLFTEENAKTIGGATWSRLKQMAKTGQKKTAVQESFMNFGLGGEERMTGQEKSMARRRAQKLEQMFGDAPPKDLFVTPSIKTVRGSPSPSPHSSHASIGSTQSSPAVPYSMRQADLSEAYQQSLQALSHLAQNDAARLGTMLDALSDPSQSYVPQAKHHNPSLSVDSMLPRTPTSPETFLDLSEMNPHSHSARRRRTGKLSQFFGETGVDFQNPPERLPGAEGKKGKGKLRREVLDGMLGEMWSEVMERKGRGTLGVDEVKRLSEMLGALRKRNSGMWEEL